MKSLRDLIRHLISTSGWSRIASSAYQKRPTCNVKILYSQVKVKFGLYRHFVPHTSHHILQVPLLMKTLISPRSYLLYSLQICPNRISDTSSLYFTGHYYIIYTSYPEGNFGGNQLLDGSISLSPLYQALTSDLHVSNFVKLPSAFPLISPLTGIDHHLSGPNNISLT